MGLKIAAILLISEGQRPGWTAETLGMTRQTLNRVMHRVNEEGLKGLYAKAKPGRPSRLKSRIRGQLIDHLDKPPSIFGFVKERWDGPTLVVHLKRAFGINLKVRQAQYWINRLNSSR